MKFKLFVMGIALATMTSAANAADQNAVDWENAPNVTMQGILSDGFQLVSVVNIITNTNVNIAGREYYLAKKDALYKCTVGINKVGNMDAPINRCWKLIVPKEK